MIARRSTYVSLAEIGAHAGLSRGAANAVFGTKSVLLLELAAVATAPLSPDAFRATPADSLVSWLDRWATPLFTADDPLALFVVLSAAAKTDPDVEHRLWRGLSEARQAATDNLELLSGRLGTAVPAGLADLFLDALFGIALTARLDQQSTRLRYERLRRYVVHAFHDGSATPTALP